MAARRKTGRPSKLTEAAAAKLVLAIREGNYYEAACGMAGVTTQTLRNWLARGEADGAPAEFAEFAAKVRAAEAEAEMLMVRIWRTAAEIEGDWRAAKAFLEGRHPERWRRKYGDGEEVSADGGPLPLGMVDRIVADADSGENS